MKKAVEAAGVLIGLGLLAKRLGPSMFERLPDDAPPKWMFRNITTIRDNTERILEILEGRELHMDSAAPRPSSDPPATSSPDE